MLAGGIALGLSGSPRQYFKTLKTIRKDWQKINQQNFNRSIQKLTDEKLLEEKMLPDGSFKMILTQKGKKQAKLLSLIGGSIKLKKPKHWDGKWRLVLFDIPEKDRTFRDILREHLKTLKFFKLQNSVFVSPHPFEKQMLELVKIYSAQPYVRVITAIKIDNGEAIKRHFLKNNSIIIGKEIVTHSAGMRPWPLFFGGRKGGFFPKTAYDILKSNNNNIPL
jgi:CRISPR-associated endonuclease Cas2